MMNFNSISKLTKIQLSHRVVSNLSISIIGTVLAVSLLSSPTPAHAQNKSLPAIKKQPVSKVMSKDILPSEDVIKLPLNKARLVTLPVSVRDVIIADPKIADVIVKTSRTVYLLAKSLGSTNIFFVGRSGDVVRHAQIQVDIDLTAAQSAMNNLLPDARINLSAINNTIVVKGNVGSAQSSADAVAVARRFVDKDEHVINMLRILADQQVALQVRIAEVQRNVIKNLAAATSFDRGIRKRDLNFSTSGGSAFATAISGSFQMNFLGLTSTSFNALESQGLVKTLAEPVLTATSGETANFLAGGEYPAPSGLDGSGNLVIEFREFGVSLSFTPVILANDRISLRISTEVSRLTSENQISLPFNDSTVPVLGLSVRRASSTINLPSGGQLMIAGLIQNDEFNDIDGTPGLKDIPILGSLFRSQEFQRNRSELVLLVKVFKIKPVNPVQKLSLPSDGFVPASDFDLYLLGRLHKKYGKAKTLKTMPRIHGPYGYVME